MTEFNKICSLLVWVSRDTDWLPWKQLYCFSKLTLLDLQLLVILSTYFLGENLIQIVALLREIRNDLKTQHDRIETLDTSFGAIPFEILRGGRTGD